MPRHRIVRAALAAVVLGLAATAVAAPAAEAATGKAYVSLRDPLSTDPVWIDVAAADTDGWATAFSGTVTLKVGRTTTSVPVSSTTGQAVVAVPTTRLAGGAATATAVLRAGGRTVRTTVKGLIDVPATVVLRGFGCRVVTPASPRIAWQVAKLNGVPVTWPTWTQAADTFPAYVHSVRPGSIADSLGQPLATKGTVTVRRGTRTVATIALKSSVRRLLFSVPWAGTVGGRFAPGTYTATLKLTDAYGRTSTAAQTVTVARSAAGLCA